MCHPSSAQQASRQQETQQDTNFHTFSPLHLYPLLYHSMTFSALHKHFTVCCCHCPSGHFLYLGLLSESWSVNSWVIFIIYLSEQMVFHYFIVLITFIYSKKMSSFNFVFILYCKYISIDSYQSVIQTAGRPHLSLHIFSYFLIWIIHTLCTVVLITANSTVAHWQLFSVSSPTARRSIKSLLMQTQNFLLLPVHIKNLQLAKHMVSFIVKHSEEMQCICCQGCWPWPFSKNVSRKQNNVHFLQLVFLLRVKPDKTTKKDIQQTYSTL